MHEEFSPLLFNRHLAGRFAQEAAARTFPFTARRRLLNLISDALRERCSFDPRKVLVFHDRVELQSTVKEHWAFIQEVCEDLGLTCAQTEFGQYLSIMRFHP